MRTRLTELLGIDIPIILAPMGGAVGPLAAATISNAGGLGNLPLWRFETENPLAQIAHMRREIAAMHSLTDRAFAINLNLAFSDLDHVDTCIDAGVPVLSFFWGSSDKMIARAKAGGAKVLQTVGSAAEAAIAENQGADVIIAQGWEAGGHVRGRVATMALIPAVVDAVHIPVVAAGGIADGRGMAAALALGASGVWVGTRFLAGSEMNIHPIYREHLLQATEDDTSYFENLFDIGWPDAPHRVLRNSTVKAWDSAGRPLPGHRPHEGEVIATDAKGNQFYRYQPKTPGPELTGNIEAFSMWAGQGVGLVRRAQPLAEILAEINSEAENTLARLSGTF